MVPCPHEPLVAPVLESMSSARVGMPCTAHLGMAPKVLLLRQPRSPAPLIVPHKPLRKLAPMLAPPKPIHQIMNLIKPFRILARMRETSQPLPLLSRGNIHIMRRPKNLRLGPLHHLEVKQRKR